MSTTPAGIAEADWLATPAAVRAFIPAQQLQEIEQLRSQLTALATELAGLREKVFVQGAGQCRVASGSAKCLTAA